MSSKLQNNVHSIIYNCIKPLRWRHNGHDGVSNHQPHHCLLNRLFGADQRKHQSSAPLAFVRGIHRGPVNSPHKWPVTLKMFPFDDVIMRNEILIRQCISFSFIPCYKILWSLFKYRFLTKYTFIHVIYIILNRWFGEISKSRVHLSPMYTARERDTENSVCAAATTRSVWTLFHGFNKTVIHILSQSMQWCISCYMGQS